MKYALFIAEQPKVLTKDTTTLWTNFQEQLKDFSHKIENGIYIPPNIVEVRIDGKMQLLYELLTMTKRFQIQSRVLFFDSQPSWIIS